MNEFNFNDNEMYNNYESWEDDDYREPQGNGLAITGMVLGIVSLVIGFLFSCCSTALGGVASILFAIAGLIISIIALSSGQSRGMSITGIICSALALIIGIVMIIIVIAVLVSLGASAGVEPYDYFAF